MLKSFFQESGTAFFVETMEGDFVGFGSELPKDATRDKILGRAVCIILSIEELVGNLDNSSRRALVGEIADSLPDIL